MTPNSNFRFEKGKVYSNMKIVQVSPTPSVHQDKFLHQVFLEIPGVAGVVQAQELSPSRESSFKAHLFKQNVSIVCIGPGDGTPAKPAWLKLDEAMAPKSEMGDRDNAFIARDAMKWAVDLFIADPKALKVHEGHDAEMLASNIGSLARQLAYEVVRIAKEL